MSKGVVTILQHPNDGVQFFKSSFKLSDGIYGQLLRFWQLIAIAKGFVLEPFEAVDFEIAGFDLADGKRSPAVFFRILGIAFGVPFRVRAVASLKLCKVLGGERAVFLGYPWDIGAGVVDPDRLCLVFFGEEDHIGLGARAVRCEGAIGKTEHSVEVAFLGEDLEDLAGLIREEDIVRHHNGCPSSGLQDAHHVLDEIELLVAG